MHQSLDAGFQFHESPVISHAGNFSREPSGGRKALLDCFPRIGQKLFVSERDTLAFAIEFENLYLHCVAYLEKLGRILNSSPRHVSYMQQSVDPAEIESANQVIFAVGDIECLPLESHPLGIVERGSVKRTVVPVRLAAAGDGDLPAIQIRNNNAVMGTVGDKQAPAGGVGKHLAREVERAIAAFGERML